MTDGDPGWRRAFDAFEHTTAARLDDLMRTELFAQLLSLGVTSTIRTRRAVEQLLTQWLHVWNVPTANDLQHLHDLLLTVDRRLRDLARELEDEEAPPPDDEEPAADPARPTDGWA